MERLAEVLTALPGLPEGAVEPEPADLLELPPTAALLAARERLAAVLAAALLPSERRRLAGRLDRLDRQLALAARRDALQAGRPPGCWCLGVGGQGRRYLPPAVASGPDGEPVHLCERYCGCPEGQALEAAHAPLRRAAQRWYAELRLREIWGRAGVPEGCRDWTLESFPADAGNAAALAAVRAWCGQRERWLLLWGPYRTGKTGLAVGAARAAAEQGRPVLFVTVPDLLDRLRSSYRGGGPGEAEVLDSLRAVDLLVLDDLGAERRRRDDDGWARERLFVLLNHRHDARRQTVLTTNLAPQALAALLGERTFWRVWGLAEVVALAGPNLAVACRAGPSSAAAVPDDGCEEEE
jgi:DNA replication protein DnaC